MRKFSKSFLALVLVAVMAVSLIASATAAVVRDDSGNISYTPLEQGVYSNGGYTIDKVSHPGRWHPDRRRAGSRPELFLVHGRGG